MGTLGTHITNALHELASMRRRGAHFSAMGLSACPCHAATS